MLETSKIFLSANSSELSCPICYCTYGLDINQPISTNCGHTICSNCFDKVSKCPFCKERFDKRRHKHQKSIFITDLIANSAKVNICQEHSEICQGFCLQDKKFVCFDCVMQNHQGHKIITIKNINEKAEKVSAVLQKARKKKESKQLELQDSLDSENKRQKRQLDEIIDQEISYLSLLKKKLYKEVDIRIISEREKYEHQLLSENLSKQCNSIEKLLSDWNKNQEVALASQILEAPSEEILGVQSFEKQVEIFKADITRKFTRETNETLKSLNAISHSSVKFKKLFLPNKKISRQIFPQAELDYLVGIFQEYNLIASPKNNDTLEIKSGATVPFIPEFDPSHFTCSLSKISLNCIENLTNRSFVTVCSILGNIKTLSDVNLHLQKIETSELTELSHLILNIKALEKFNVQLDLVEASQESIHQFMQHLIYKSALTLDIQYKEPHTIISFQTSPSNILKEVSLNVGGNHIVVCEALNALNSVESLKILRLSLGKTDCNFEVVEAVCKALEVQNELEELNFICEDLNDLTDSNIIVFLSAANQIKKLGIFIEKVSISNGSWTTKFLPKAHPCLENIEELTLKIKYNSGRVYSERFECLIDFLATSKALKKLCLQFDGVHFYYGSAEKLFTQIVKLGSLVLLELEFLNLRGLNHHDQRDLETILNELPGSVTKKVVFQKSNNSGYFHYDYNASDFSGDDISYRDHSEEEIDEDDYY